MAKEKAHVRVIGLRFKVALIEVDGLAVALGLAVERREREEWFGEGGIASNGVAVVAGGVGWHVPFLVRVAEIVVLVGIALSVHRARGHIAKDQEGGNGGERGPRPVPQGAHPASRKEQQHRHGWQAIAPGDEKQDYGKRIASHKEREQAPLGSLGGAQKGKNPQ